MQTPVLILSPKWSLRFACSSELRSGGGGDDDGGDGGGDGVHGDWSVDGDHHHGGTWGKCDVGRADAAVEGRELGK